MRHPGDLVHGAQHRRHEEVLRCTLFHPGAESVVLVARCLRVLLLCRVRRHPWTTLPVTARLVHVGPDRPGGTHRAERSGAGDEGAEDRGRGQSVGHQVAGHHPGVHHPGVPVQGQADVDQRVRRDSHHLLRHLHGVREGDLLHLRLHPLITARTVV